MIIVRLLGGLGNQLFQYALGRRLSYARGVPLRFDISFYGEGEKRSYQLDQFQIDAETISREELQSLSFAFGQNVASRAYRLTQRVLFPYYRRRRVYEQIRGYDPNILRVSKTAFLHGYWQTGKYGQPVEHILRKELVLRNGLHPVNAKWAEKIRSHCAVSVHIRRTDYLDPRWASALHTCGLDYYEQAIQLIRERHPDATFYFFSDDPSWVRQNIHTAANHYYVENNDTNRDWETIHLMGLCQHHVIANSTFSWWGAWMGQNPNKTVVAPQKWFVEGGGVSNNHDIVPDEWIRI